MIREVGERYYDLGNLIYRERVQRAEAASRLLLGSQGVRRAAPQPRHRAAAGALRSALHRLLCVLPGKPGARAAS